MCKVFSIICAICSFTTNAFVLDAFSMQDHCTVTVAIAYITICYMLAFWPKLTVAEQSVSLGT